MAEVSTELRILITGSREWKDKQSMYASFERAVSFWAFHHGGALPDQVTVVHGTASGADTLAVEIATELGYTVEEHPADWARHNDDCPTTSQYGCNQTKNRCARAGVRRNEEMVHLGADILLAFIVDNSPGSTHCFNYATKRFIPSIAQRIDTAFGTHNTTHKLPGFDVKGEIVPALF